MKKYVKPELFYEKFELTQHIADCAWELNSAQGSCNASADPDLIPGVTEPDRLFTADINGCSFIPGVNYQDFCYHDGAQGVNVFMS